LSLDSIMSLNYLNFELIVVDNGSNDNSYDFIQKHFSKMGEKKCTELKICRLKKNTGFTGGINAGFRIINIESEYVFLVNNDAILFNDALTRLVSALEADEKIGAAQGIVLERSGNRIDSAGGIIDELLRSNLIRNKEYPCFENNLEVSFVEGTLPIYRITAIKKFYKDCIFLQEGFIFYLDDVLNGLLLWNLDYKCITFPFIIGRHSRGSTLKKNETDSFLTYLLWRNRVALLNITNTKFKRAEILFEIRNILISIYSMNFSQLNSIIKGIISGKLLGRHLKSRFSNINIYKCPIIYVDIKSILFTEVIKKLRNKKYI